MRAELTMSRQGRAVTILRRDVGGSTECAYSGILSRDERRVSGGYSCNTFSGTRPWQATIGGAAAGVATAPSTDGIWGLGVQLGFAEAGARVDASPQLLTESLRLARDLANASRCLPSGEIEATRVRMSRARSARPLYGALSALRQRYARLVAEGCECGGSSANASRVFANGVNLGIAEHTAASDGGVSFLVTVLTNALNDARATRCLPPAPIEAAIGAVRRARSGRDAYPTITALRQSYAGMLGSCACGAGGARVVPRGPQPNMCVPGCGPGTTCVNGTCVGTGDVRVTLTWDRPGDMDLHVITPSGEHIYYGDRTGQGGQLDRDDRRGNGPENIFWDRNAPRGTYNVCVVPFSIRQPTSFELTVHTPRGPDRTLRGSRQRSGGGSTCQPGAPNFVTQFTL